MHKSDRVAAWISRKYTKGKARRSKQGRVIRPTDGQQQRARGASRRTMCRSPMHRTSTMGPLTLLVPVGAVQEAKASQSAALLP